MADDTLTARTRVMRRSQRARYDRDSIHTILDAARICHVGVVRDGLPVVLPTIHARDGDTVLLHACDPGTDVDIEPPTSPLDALQLPALRGVFLADALSTFPHDVADCYADRLTAQISVEQVVDPPPGFLDRELPRLAREAVTGCQ